MKFSMKKMVSPGNHYNGQVLRPCPVEHIGQRYGVILLAMNQQGIRRDLGQRPLAGGAADQHQTLGRLALMLKTFLQLRLHEGTE